MWYSNLKHIKEEGINWLAHTRRTYPDLPHILDEFDHLESHLDGVVRVHRICIRHARDAVVAITQDLDSHAFVQLESR